MPPTAKDSPSSLHERRVSDIPVSSGSPGGLGWRLPSAIEGGGTLSWLVHLTSAGSLAEAPKRCVAAEFATLEWVAWYNHQRSHSALLAGRGHYTAPADHETNHCRQQSTATPAVTQQPGVIHERDSRGAACWLDWGVT